MSDQQPQYTDDFRKVIEAECGDNGPVHHRRSNAGLTPPKPLEADSKDGPGSAKEPELPYYEVSGLALSGGGIRSGSFSVGFLQALYKKGVLRQLDYLSTVSGGGYAGAFLTALATTDNGLTWDRKPGPEKRTETGDSNEKPTDGKAVADNGDALRPGADRRQPWVIRRLINAGLTMRRPIRFSMNFFVGWMLLNALLICVLTSATAAFAAVFRLLDHPDASEQLAYMGFLGDIARPFFPAAVLALAFMGTFAASFGRWGRWPVVVFLAVWIYYSYFSVSVVQAYVLSGVLASVLIMPTIVFVFSNDASRSRDKCHRIAATFFFSLCCICTAAAIVMVITTGNLSTQHSAPVPEVHDKHMALANVLTIVAICVQIVTLVPAFEIDRLVKSGTQSSKPASRWIFNLTALSIVVGLPLLFFGYFAGEDMADITADYGEKIGQNLLKRSDSRTTTPPQIPFGGRRSFHRASPQLRPLDYRNPYLLCGSDYTDLSTLVAVTRQRWEDGHLADTENSSNGDVANNPAFAFEKLIAATVALAGLQTELEGQNNLHEKRALRREVRLLQCFLAGADSRDDYSSGCKLLEAAGNMRLRGVVEKGLVLAEALETEAVARIEQSSPIWHADGLNRHWKRRAIFRELVSDSLNRYIINRRYLHRLFKPTDSAVGAYLKVWLTAPPQADRSTLKRQLMHRVPDASSGDGSSYSSESELPADVTRWATTLVAFQRAAAADERRILPPATVAGSLQSPIARFNDTQELRRHNRAALTSYLGLLAGHTLISPPGQIYAYNVASHDWEYRTEEALLFFFVAVAISLISLNAGSLHSFYRLNLSRIWLNASPKAEEMRNSAPSQGLFELLRCWSKSKETDSATRKSDEGKPVSATGSPFPVINATVHYLDRRRSIDEHKRDKLCLPGQRSSRFELTPLYCGDHYYGFERTKTFNNQDLSLANAMTISGSALSPLATNHLLVRALLFVSNIRTGEWVTKQRIRSTTENPGHRLRGTPFKLLFDTVAGFFVEKEASRVGAHSSILLTDGGHFDNLGLGALFRRRAKIMICVDASEDPNGKFEDLLKLFRRWRVMHGLKFSSCLDGDLSEDVTGATLEGLVKRREKVSRNEGASCQQCGQSAESTEHRYAERHYSIIKVQYPEGLEGYLFYVKPNFDEDEPAELLRYRDENPNFPYDPTLDQFYEQRRFECYRQLGEHIGQRLFEREFSWQAMRYDEGAAPEAGPNDSGSPKPSNPASPAGGSEAPTACDAVPVQEAQEEKQPTPLPPWILNWEPQPSASARFRLSSLSGEIQSKYVELGKQAREERAKPESGDPNDPKSSQEQDASTDEQLKGFLSDIGRLVKAYLKVAQEYRDLDRQEAIEELEDELTELATLLYQIYRREFEEVEEMQSTAEKLKPTAATPNV